MKKICMIAFLAGLLQLHTASHGHWNTPLNGVGSGEGDGLEAAAFCFLVSPLIPIAGILFCCFFCDSGRTSSIAKLFMLEEQLGEHKKKHKK